MFLHQLHILSQNIQILTNEFFFFLLGKGLIKPDETFLNLYLQNKLSNKTPTSFDNKNELDVPQTYYYLYPNVKEFLEEKIQKQIIQIGR